MEVLKRLKASRIRFKNRAGYLDLREPLIIGIFAGLLSPGKSEFLKVPLIITYYKLS